MREIVDNCVGCTSMGLYCMGVGCPNRAHEVYTCDKCHTETELYYYEGKELCMECIMEMVQEELEKNLDKVEESW